MTRDPNHLPAGSARTGKETSPSNAPPPRHVLVVEDSILIAMDTEDILRQLGIDTVTIAESVAVALASIEGDRPDFAILDYDLGAESSDPVAERLRELHIPFVLATGHSELETQVQEQGALGLLTKPYGKMEIAAALERLAGR